MRNASMYFSVKGATQGQFKPDANLPKGALANGISAHAWNVEVIAPRDANSGLPTGKRLHKPLIVVKHLDAASPQFFSALCTNESLPKVILEWYRPVPGKKEMAPHTRVTLTNASLARFSMDVHESDVSTAAGAAGGGDSLTAGGDGGDVSEVQMERIEFTFQRIEIENIAGKTSYEDNWEA